MITMTIPIVKMPLPGDNEIKRGVLMKAKIDRDGCISCGLCPDVCPEVFRMADDGKAEVHVDEVPHGLEGQAEEAADGCPVSVISVE
jgi:ferredoxin